MECGFARLETFNAVKEANGSFWSGGMVGLEEADLYKYKSMQAFLLYERANEEITMLKVKTYLFRMVYFHDLTHLLIFYFLSHFRLKPKTLLTTAKR